MSESTASITVYQLRVVLRHVTPLVWRRVLVRSDTSIAQRHRVIQVTMGWDDIHLHRFRIHGKDYGSGSIGTTCGVDRHAVTLASLRLHPRERFAYIYNVHAWWQHDIWLEQVLEADARRQYPVCIGGKHASPPEDCGGPGDYRTRLQERTSFAALDDLALVAAFVGRWLEHDVRGTEDEQVEVAAALERMAERRHLDPDQFDRRAVNAALAQLTVATDVRV